MRDNCKEVRPYFSKDSEVYHFCSTCTTGNNIEPDMLRRGNPGRRRKCKRCVAIKAGRIRR
jgi:hypothetical protein